MQRTLLIFLFLAGPLAQGAKVLPVLNTPISNLSRLSNTTSDSISLDTVFGTEPIDDQVVRFTTQTSVGSLVLDFALFSNRTPGTRANFLNYVNDGDYLNSIIHRSVPGFVIQGGAFYDSDASTGSYFLDPVRTDAPIPNEFGISSTLGTISMAKQAGNPDSATSQWFVSIGENSDILDAQNGGFTVFGRITQSTLPNARSIGDPADFPIWNAGGAFAELPLNPEFENNRNIIESDFVLFTSVSLVDIPPTEAGMVTTLTYSIVANSNPSVLSASINESSMLHLDYSGSAPGSTTITIRATDSVGNTVDDTFIVSVSFRSFEDWQDENFDTAELFDPNISNPESDPNNDGLTNLELYLHDLDRTDFLISPVVFTETEISNASYPTFTFPIRNDLADITYTIEQSDDLGLTDAWTAVSATEISLQTNGAMDTVSIRTTSAMNGPNDFYRINFSQAP